MPEFPFRYVPGCAVEYRGPTNTGGSVWAAVIRRGRDRGDQYRATVPFSEGPDAWQVIGAALSMDGGDRYSYPVGPADLAAVLPAPAPRRPDS